MTTLSEPPLPRLIPESEFFWTAGRDGVMRVLRCADCGIFAHPPTPQCRTCGSTGMAPSEVSGRATLWTWTVSYQQLVPSLDVPYTVAVVALDEQPDVHLTTRLVEVPLEDLRVGLPLQVHFEQHGEVFLPLFTLAHR